MKLLNYIYLTVFTLFLSSSFNLSLSQNDKTRARMVLKYFDMSINEKYLTIKLIARIDRVYQPVPDAVLEIYLNEMTESGKLGTISLNDEGLGSFTLPRKFFNTVDTLSEFTFFCTLKDHPSVADIEQSLTIQAVDLRTEYVDQDSLRWIRVVVLEKSGADNYKKVNNVEVKFFVTRPFNLLPISEPMRTDSAGRATILFPNDLPGDATGHLTAVVKIDDSDEYGTVEERQTVQWGIPTVFDDQSLKRSLWAAGANAPIMLLLLTNSLIAITWGIIFYIIYEIYSLSKIKHVDA